MINKNKLINTKINKDNFNKSAIKNFLNNKIKKNLKNLKIYFQMNRLNWIKKKKMMDLILILLMETGLN
jgi:hypothetical protein